MADESQSPVGTAAIAARAVAGPPGCRSAGPCALAGRLWAVQDARLASGGDDREA